MIGAHGRNQGANRLLSKLKCMPAVDEGRGLGLEASRRV